MFETPTSVSVLSKLYEPDCLLALLTFDTSFPITANLLHVHNRFEAQKMSATIVSIPATPTMAGPEVQWDPDHLSSTKEALEAYMNHLLCDLEQNHNPNERSLHQRILHVGLRILLGRGPVPDTQPWSDLVDYSIAVILAPKDESSRNSSPWTRSTSAMSRELRSRYGPDTVRAAKEGHASLIADHFDGQASNIPHVNKKTNFLRYFGQQVPGKAYCPATSPLATITYETGNVACSLVLLAWAPVDDAVVYGMLTHHAICDDYHKFSQEEVALRVRLVAMGVGAAHALGENGPSAILDGSLLQSHGTGTAASIRSAMAWRAISGCSTPYNGSHFGPTSPDEAVAPPMMMIAIHDLLDWRSDTAAGNHENAVTATYGLGINDPFHTFLESTLELAVTYPAATLSSAAALTFLHYTGTRYGAYEYSGQHGPPCGTCIGMLRQATEQGGMKWRPTRPPRSFADGAEAREAVKKFIDDQVDTGMVQEGLSWLQYIILTGEVWLFDLLRDGVKPVDPDTAWA